MPEFGRTKIAVKILANDMIDSIIDDLNEQNKNASFKLAKSLKSETIQTANIIKVNFKAKSYWRQVDKGRRPGKFVPIAPLTRWAKQKLGIQDEEEARSTAFAISRSIKKKGTEGTNIFTNNIEKYKKEFRNLSQTAPRQDIIEQINKILNTK